VRFPDASAFLDGLKARMTTLTPIHLQALARLADLYGDAAVRDALAVATTYRNFNARAIARILARAHPTAVPEPAVGPAPLRPEALGALDDVDPGSPQTTRSTRCPRREDLPMAPRKADPRIPSRGCGRCSST
jgi:hypothetical protein